MSDGLERVAIVAVEALRELATALEEALRDAPQPIPFSDIVDRLPVNRQPDHPDMVRGGLAWWPLRAPSAIKGLTIHHTMSHSPEATASYCSRSQKAGGKGYPSIQYHFWVSAGDGCPVYRCAPVEWMIWHDHTGGRPVTLSVGMAGTWHVHAPATEQIVATARLVAWLMRAYNVPLAEVRGHDDRFSGTVCPGWQPAKWRNAFMTALAVEVARGGSAGG